MFKQMLTKPKMMFTTTFRKHVQEHALEFVSLSPICTSTFDLLLSLFSVNTNAYSSRAVSPASSTWDYV
jgi:hypothetical protein